MRSTIIADIIAKIFPNQEKLITAQKLQDVLVNLIAKVGVLGQDAGLRDHDPTRSYAIGDTCIKGNVIFRALDEVEGAFNAANWQVVAQMPVVDTLALRDALSWRFEGMLCYVKANLTTYRLVGGVANSNWQALGRIELHTYRFKPTSGQQDFTIPDRQIVELRINGVAYGSASYSLNSGDGTYQTLVWDIDQFILDEADVLELLYAGAEVALTNSTVIAPGVRVKQIEGLAELFLPSPVASVVAPVLPASGGYWGVAFGNSVWSVAGRSNTDWLISSDNANTLQVTPGPNRDYEFVNFANGWFIAMAQLAGSNIARSQDGINWTVSSYGSYWQYADFGDGVWMACAWNSQIVARSINDGANWSGVSMPEGNTWRDIKFGDGVWLVAGSSTTTTYNLMRSTDGGLTFTGITLPSVVSSLRYGAGVWLAWSSSTMYRSTDGGQTWNEVDTGYTGSGDMVWTGQYFIKFTGNKVLWSEDGQQWQYDRDLPGGVDHIRRANYNNGTIVGASYNNKLVVVRLRTPVYAGDPVSALENDAGYMTVEDVPEQVNADWDAMAGPAEVFNKPLIVTVNTPTRLQRVNYGGDDLLDSDVIDNGIDLVLNRIEQVLDEPNGYGLLYDKSTAGNPLLPPDGWRLPTESEFQNIVDMTNGDRTLIGKKLGTSPSPNIVIGNHPANVRSNGSDPNLFAGTDLYQFTAYPNGYKSASNGTYPNGQAYYAYWTSGKGFRCSSHDNFSIVGLVPNEGFAIRFVFDGNGTPSSDIITDHNGNEYRWIKIGDLIIMAEDFRGTKLSDDTDLINATAGGDWTSVTDPKFSYPFSGQNYVATTSRGVLIPKYLLGHTEDGKVRRVLSEDMYINGQDGRTVLNGTVDPAVGDGANGDFWINTTTNEIFGPKAGGSWGAGTSLVGPEGPAGADGQDGAQGPQGEPGPAGADGQDGINQNPDWSQISGKPATYPPSSHNHDLEYASLSLTNFFQKGQAGKVEPMTITSGEVANDVRLSNYRSLLVDAPCKIMNPIGATAGFAFSQVIFGTQHTTPFVVSFDTEYVVIGDSIPMVGGANFEISIVTNGSGRTTARITNLS